MLLIRNYDNYELKLEMQGDYFKNCTVMGLQQKMHII